MSDRPVIDLRALRSVASARPSCQSIDGRGWGRGAAGSGVPSRGLRIARGYVARPGGSSAAPNLLRRLRAEVDATYVFDPGVSERCLAFRVSQMKWVEVS